jgi:hypothetical protein
MATSIQTIITRARRTLVETTPRFWSDQELLEIAIEGVQDLWKAIKSVNQHYLATIDITNVSLAANALQLTGVPADVAIMLGIEPRTPDSNINCFFRPRNYFDPVFAQARTQAAEEPNGLTIWYDLTGAGAPVSAPIVRTAPKVTTAIPLQFSYVPTLDASTITTASSNPIPGETDHMLKCWIVAHARAKENESRTPDPTYLGMYSADRAELVSSVLPKRQEDEPDIAGAVFENAWDF